MDKIIPLPHNWNTTIAQSVEEGLFPEALVAIEGLMVDGHYAPSNQHVQLLLYLCITPPSALLNAGDPINFDGVPSPLGLLYRILDAVGPEHLLPCIPSIFIPPRPNKPRRGSSPQKQAEIDTPPWLTWQAFNKPDKRVQRRMDACRNEGVWALLSEPEARPKKEGRPKVKRERDRKGKSKSRSKSKSTSPNKRSRSPKKRLRFDEESQVPDWDDSSELSELSELSDADSDADSGPRTLSAEGWMLLEFLVALWVEEASSKGRSAGLLAQLRPPMGGNMAHDDASAPLAVVRQAFNLASSSSSQPSPTPLLPDLYRRRKTAATLLALLMQLAAPPKPPFHTSTLTSDLVSLLRAPPGTLGTLLAALRTSPDLPPSTLAHILTLALEDALGMRAERTRARKTKAAGLKPGPWAEPHVAYALELVGEVGHEDVGASTSSRRTSGRSGRGRGSNGHSESETPSADEERAAVLAAHLITVLARLDPHDEAWETARDIDSTKPLVRAALRAAVASYERGMETD